MQSKVKQTKPDQIEGENDGMEKMSREDEDQSEKVTREGKKQRIRYIVNLNGIRAANINVGVCAYVCLLFERVKLYDELLRTGVSCLFLLVFLILSYKILQVIENSVCTAVNAYEFGWNRIECFKR